MKEEAIVITIDFGINHFSAIYLNNQLKLVSSNGSMISINDPRDLKAHNESESTARLLDYFKELKSAA
jgi:hypothetical protein